MQSECVRLCRRMIHAGLAKSSMQRDLLSAVDYAETTNFEKNFGKSRQKN
jgi:hypothetical protein